MNPETLHELWRSLADGHDVSGMDRRRLDTEASLDMFACIFWPSRRLGLLIESDDTSHSLTDRIPNCRGVKVIQEEIGTNNSRTILWVILEDESLLEIFTVLSADLVNAVKAEQDAGIGLRRCIDRLLMWQGLLERVPAEGLSEEVQRGLFGELTVLENFCLTELGIFDAVTSWTGSEVSHQDFKIGDSAVEVKTTMGKRHVRISINSEKQLDERPHHVLLLTYVQLEESNAYGISLPSLVARLRLALQVDPVISREFDRRLMLGGYLDIHAPSYERKRYRVAIQRYFHVQRDFPRLTEANLPAGVGDIRYTIIVDDLSEYEVMRKAAIRLVMESND